MGIIGGVNMGESNLQKSNRTNSNKHILLKRTEGG